MRKDKSGYWSNIYSKPKKFGFVRLLTYKCQIMVRLYNDNKHKFLEPITLEYKIFNGAHGDEIDEELFMKN